MKPKEDAGEALAERAWYALHCLPRDARGEPPMYSELEDKVKLSNGVLSKLMLGRRKSPTWGTLVKLASALEVSLDWLAKGEGTPPKPTGYLPPRVPWKVEALGVPPRPVEVEPNSELAKALRYIDEAHEQHPDASPLELLLAAQILAVRDKS